MTPELHAQMVRIRTDAGLSKRKVAKRIGVTAASITHIDQGKNDPSVGFLERFAEACGARVVLATGAEGEAASAVASLPSERRTMALRFTRALSRTRAESMATVQAFVEFIERAAVEGQDIPGAASVSAEPVDGIVQQARRGRIK